MGLFFKAIELDEQAAYLRLLAQTPTATSDYSFINVWGWAEAYGLSWAWDEGLVWIRQERPEPLYWAPVGPWPEVDWSRVLAAHFEAGTGFARVPEALLHLWRTAAAERLTSEESRGDWDYVYAFEDLLTLKGNRYHKKKNLLNQFKNRYAFAYMPLSAGMVEQAKGMQTDWCTWRDCESSEVLEAENRVIAKVLRHWDRLQGLLGGALDVDGRMVAYTLGERLGTDMLLIHFEKGDPEYRGVYQAVNQLFLENAGSPYATVNRMQDVDSDGLRRAKLSYHPIEFYKKYRVRLQ